MKSTLSARETIHKLVVIMKHHKQIFNKMREQTGLGRSAHRLLMIISDDKDSLSQTALAERLEISTAAVAVLIKKMEADKLISREINAADTRFNSISITENGRKIVEYSKSAFEKIDSAVLEGFSGEDMEIFNGYVDRILNNICEFEKGEEVIFGD